MVRTHKIVMYTLVRDVGIYGGSKPKKKKNVRKNDVAKAIILLL